MEFNYQELARLNEIISVAITSGKVACDDISKEVHRKVTEEILKRNIEISNYFLICLFLLLALSVFASSIFRPCY